MRRRWPVLLFLFALSLALGLFFYQALSKPWQKTPEGWLRMLTEARIDTSSEDPRVIEINQRASQVPGLCPWLRENLPALEGKARLAALEFIPWAASEDGGECFAELAEWMVSSRDDLLPKDLRSGYILTTTRLGPERVWAISFSLSREPECDDNELTMALRALIRSGKFHNIPPWQPDPQVDRDLREMWNSPNPTVAGNALIATVSLGTLDGEEALRMIDAWSRDPTRNFDAARVQLLREQVGMYRRR